MLDIIMFIGRRALKEVISCTTMIICKTVMITSVWCVPDIDCSGAEAVFLPVAQVTRRGAEEHLPRLVGYVGAAIDLARQHFFFLASVVKIDMCIAHATPIYLSIYIYISSAF